MQDTYPLHASDVVLHKTPVTFDVSVWELFWPFISGASVVLAAPGAHRDPAAMGQNLKKALQEALKQVSVLSTEALVEARFERLMAYGRVKEQAVG